MLLTPHNLQIITNYTDVQTYCNIRQINTKMLNILPKNELQDKIDNIPVLCMFNLEKKYKILKKYFKQYLDENHKDIIGDDHEYDKFTIKDIYKIDISYITKIIREFYIDDFIKISDISKFHHDLWNKFVVNYLIYYIQPHVNKCDCKLFNLHNLILNNDHHDDLQYCCGTWLCSECIYEHKKKYCSNCHQEQCSFCVGFEKMDLKEINKKVDICSVCLFLIKQSSKYQALNQLPDKKTDPNFMEKINDILPFLSICLIIIFIILIYIIK